MCDLDVNIRFFDMHCRLPSSEDSESDSSESVVFVCKEVLRYVCMLLIVEKVVTCGGDLKYQAVYQPLACTFKARGAPCVYRCKQKLGAIPFTPLLRAFC